MSSEYQDKIYDFFSDDLNNLSVDELLVSAGHNFSGARDIDKNATRSYREVHYKISKKDGSTLLLRILPFLKKIICNSKNNDLNQVYKNSIFKELSKNSIGFFLENTQDIFKNFNLKKDTIIFLTASLLKNGLKSIITTDGISPLEARLSYLEFDLKIFESKIFSISNDGEVSDDLEYDTELLEKYLLLIENNDIENQEEYGRFLWNILFPKKINSHFERCMGEVKASANFKGIRIRLSIEYDRLIKVPWELARYEPTGEYLAVSSNIILSRYVHRQGRSQKEDRIAPIYNLAILISEPSTLKGVNATHELNELKKIENNSMNIIEITPRISERLREVIEDTRVDIFHYIGHGSFYDDKGYLYLENKNKTHDRYSADRLANVLNSKTQIVVLNSCKGAESSGYSIFSGMAVRLIQKKIPAVIAMQYNITNQSAIIFSKVFYQKIANGYPIEYSVQKARQAIFNDIGDTRKDFITPCLFLDY